MIDRSRLFRLAWTTARHLMARDGLSARQAFSPALRQAWRTLKAVAASDAALADATAGMIAEIRTLKASGHRFHDNRRWRFANAHPMGGI